MDQARMGELAGASESIKLARIAHSRRLSHAQGGEESGRLARAARGISNSARAL